MLDVNKNYPFRLQCAPLFKLSPTEKHHNILVYNVNEVLAPSTNKLFKTSTRPKRHEWNCKIGNKMDQFNG